MKQVENSYTTFKKDIEEDYKKHKHVFNPVFAVFGVIIIGCAMFLFWGIKSVNDNNNDSEVRQLMWSTQNALDSYYKQNQTYPSDIRSVEIRHSNDTFKVISSTEIEYLGYKINYSETNNQDYKLETNFRGPMMGGKYILYNDKR
ncbi:type II secretion system protein [Candidatus Woesebacteria bacterium]|nr:type II secretion system protein [Candidatus Woesebacteria bacterium]